MTILIATWSLNKNIIVLETGEIFEWDVNSRTCIKKFMDDGCLKGTSLAISYDDKYLAAGSSSGVVNLYKLPCDVNPKPEKTILNLVTSVSKLCFNKSSDILAMASHQKNDAVKLVVINIFFENTLYS